MFYDFLDSERIEEYMRFYNACDFVVCIHLFNLSGEHILVCAQNSIFTRIRTARYLTRFRISSFLIFKKYLRKNCKKPIETSNLCSYCNSKISNTSNTSFLKFYDPCTDTRSNALLFQFLSFFQCSK